MPHCSRIGHAAGWLLGLLAGIGFHFPQAHPPLPYQECHSGKGRMSWPSIFSLLGTILESSET